MTTQAPSIRSTQIEERNFPCSREKLTNTDFGQFYVAHQHFIDEVIAIWAFKYSSTYDVEDIRQEVLYRLQLNDILKQYDHTQAQLNTFLTSKIKNYIRHAVRSLPHRENVDEFDEYKHSGHNDDVFESICFKDRLTKLKDKFGPEVWEFVCMLQKGLNLSEIAEAKKVSKYCISSQYMGALKSKASWKILTE